MNQSFYTKQGIDFLYFARPGTAYGPGAFQQQNFTQTTSGFYDAQTKQVKPVELIKSKSQKPNALLTQLWFERAEKVMKQLDHLGRLLEFFSYVAQISFRFYREYVPQLKEETDKKAKLKKTQLIKDMRQFLELYQTYQPDYDYFDHKHSQTFFLFQVSSLKSIYICSINKNKRKLKGNLIRFGIGEI